jgi:hypothetical protein
MAIKKIPNLEIFQWQQSVKTKTLSSPPGGESKGDRYIVAATGGGSWTGHTNDIATYDGSTWEYVTAYEGLICWIEDINKYYYFNGSSWKSLIKIGGIIS